MRFILGLLMAVSTAYGAANYMDATGTVKTLDKKYAVVVNSAAAAVTVGKPVCWDLTADDGMSIDLCSDDGDAPACVMAETSCAVGAKCKCQTYGYISNLSVSAGGGTAAAGSVVFASQHGYATIIESPTAGYDVPFAVMLDTVSTTTTGEAFLRIPGGN